MAVTGLLLTGACAVEAEDDVRARTRGTGTELGDGLEVAKGSALVGTVFPGQSLSGNISAQGSVASADSWTAILQLDGNPITVLNRYLRQAADSGFDVGAECLLAYDDGRGVVPRPRSPDPEGLRSLTCKVIGNADIDGASPISLSMELRRSAGSTPYEDTIIIRVAHHPAGASPQLVPQGWDATLPAAWKEGVPSPPEQPRVAKVGQPIRREDPQYARLIDVVEGTRLLAPPALPCWLRGGFDAVLEVKGDVADALDAYEAQFEDIGFTVDRGSSEFREHAVTFDEGVGDAGNYAAIAVHGEGEQPTYLHLWFCPPT
ncbi:MAG: hypothetical protein ACRDY6_08590 [Acidimicrobiia bacterium]